MKLLPLARVEFARPTDLPWERVAARVVACENPLTTLEVDADFKFVLIERVGFPVRCIPFHWIGYFEPGGGFWGKAK